MSLAHTAVSEAEFGGTGYARGMAHWAMGNALLYQCEFESSAAASKKAIEIMEGENIGHLGSAMGILAQAEVALGNLERAREIALEAVGFCHEHQLYWELPPWLASAQAHTGLGDRQGALAALEETHSLIDRTGAVVVQPFLHERRAEFARAFDSDWDAASELQHAKDAFSKLGAQGHVERLTKRH